MMVIKELRKKKKGNLVQTKVLLEILEYLYLKSLVLYHSCV